MFKLPFGKKKDAPAAEADTPAETPAAEGGEGEADATPKKKKLPLLFIIIPAALLVLGGGGAGAWFLFLKPAPAEAGEHGEAAPPDHAPAKAESGGHGGGGGEGEADAALGTVRAGPDGVTFLTLPDLIVNIQSADGRPTFLKLTLTLEMHDAHLASTLQAQSPRVNDMLQTFLRELRPDDLAGSGGSYQLRQEILRRINLVAAPGEVDAVLIEEMLIQ